MPLSPKLILELMRRTGMRPGRASAPMLMLLVRRQCLARLLVPGRGRMNAAIDVPDRVSFRALVLPEFGAGRAGTCRRYPATAPVPPGPAGTGAGDAGDVP